MSATPLKRTNETPASSDGEPVTNVILAGRNGLISGDSEQSLRVGGSLNINGPGGGKIIRMYQGPACVSVVFQNGTNLHVAYIPNQNVALSANFQTTPVGPAAA